MSCAIWRIIRRPEFREDLDAIEAWIAWDNVSAAVAMWLLIDDQVEQLADPDFPRRPSTRVAGAHELVAHENYIVYFDQDESTCSITVRTVVWKDSFRSTCQRWEREMALASSSAGRGPVFERLDNPFKIKRPVAGQESKREDARRHWDESARHNGLGGST